MLGIIYQRSDKRTGYHHTVPGGDSRGTHLVRGDGGLVTHGGREVSDEGHFCFVRGRELEVFVVWFFTVWWEKGGV